MNYWIKNKCLNRVGERQFGAAGLRGARHSSSFVRPSACAGMADEPAAEAASSEPASQIGSNRPDGASR